MGSDRKGGAVERVGARELKQHTSEIIERVLLILRGEAVALISPRDQQAVEVAIEAEAHKAETSPLSNRFI